MAWVGLLHEFALTTRLLADTLPDDRGGRDTATAFGDLMRYLAEQHSALRNPPSEFFGLAAAVTNLLRKIEPHLPPAEFKLPPDDPGDPGDPGNLRKRLSRLGLVPKRPRRQKRPRRHRT